ncbi:MAG: PLP-dependent aminotransferase family protein, partial [Thermomicrobiales bacterium]
MSSNLSSRQGIRSKVAKRTAAYAESSIWNDLVDLKARHPDTIYFGDGSPAPEAMPVERLRQASAHALEEAPDFLGYGETAGFEPLRQYVAETMSSRGIDVGSEAIQITAGSSQGIELISRIMVDPGDVILVESPTFLGAIEIFQTYQARVVGVAVDEEGMDMAALEQALIAEPRTKIIYTIPTFHNPLGVTLPFARRQRMVELAARFDVVIVEDDPYWELQYDGDVVPPIRSLDENVVHLGTFSKSIAPAVRTGWIVTPPSLRRLLLAAREVMDLHNDRITMRTVYYTAQDYLAAHLQTARSIYRARRDTMLNALQRELGDIAGATWSRPQGGFFVWVTLPEAVDVEIYMRA